MKADPVGVLTGVHQLTGNEACAEGALAAGCRFLGTYPIMPAVEICDRFLKRGRTVNATFVQMEDEISALACVLGAVWTGKRAMSVTSGPGFSLMMEHIGLAVMLETPCVIVNVQHLGPGIGLVDQPAQGDMMQARWGSHGDYEVIALAPSSPQEMFNFTIKAFNLAERFRTPVMIMSDANIAQLREEVIIPSADEIEIEPRRYYEGPKDKYLPFKRDEDFVPRMVDIGQGYKFHVTGLTHDDRGYPIMFEECQEYNVHPLVWKIRKNSDKIIDFTETRTEDAETIVISYGSTTRIALKAVEEARRSGLKVGHLKLNTVWPFPDKRITELSKRIKGFVVPEINFGQIVFEVERCNYGHTSTYFVSIMGKEYDPTQSLLNAIDQALKGNSVKEGIIEIN
ncbi:MAG: 2-oxoacid:acceptor oxidoreductase subunit alpha [candidate division WOR-3 bacterium]